MNLTKLFTSINNNLSILDSWEEGKDTLTDYLECIEVYQRRQRHLDRVIDKLDLLIQDPRWTPQMTRIFKDYIPKDSQVLKDIE